ncbi:MAG: flavin reductase family protein [Eubacteriales bacterium]
METKLKENFKPDAYIFPVPVVLVSCGIQGEKENIITIAWTGVANSEPPMTYLSIRKNRYSHQLIKDTGEFVINLVDKNMLDKVDHCGIVSGRDENKFEFCGFTSVKALMVNSPAIQECPVQIACKVVKIMELGSHDMFLAEIISVSGDWSLKGRDNELDIDRINLMAYSNGGYYELGEKLGEYGFSKE